MAADDRYTFKFDGDASGLIKANKNAQKALGGTAKSAEKTEKEIKDVGTQSKKTATATTALASSTKGLSASFKVAAAGAAALATGLLAAGAASFKMLQSMADAQNELSDLSARTGVATKTLAGLRLAAKGSGQDFKAISSALKPLTLRLGQASIGSKTAIDGFKAVGVEVRNASGEMKSADEVLIEISRNLSAMEDPSERATSAALAFGSAGTKLVQALGGQELQTFIDAAEKFGMDTGPEAAKAADEWQRATSELSLVMQPFNTGILETGTKLLDRFALGFVYLKALMRELSKDPINNLVSAFKLLFSDVLTASAEFARLTSEAILFPLEKVAEALEYFGQTGPIEAIQKLNAANEELAATIKGYAADVKEGVAETSALANAYSVATEEARAFYDLQNAQTERTGAPATGIGTPATATPTGQPQTVAEEQKEVQTELQKTIGLINQYRLSMDQASDSSRTLSSVFGEIGRVVSSLTEADDPFKGIENSLESIGTIAGGFANVMSDIIAQQMRNSDELTDKQKKNIKILFAIQKAAAIASIVTNTAAAIMKALAELGPVAGGVAAGFIGGLGATQAAIVAAEKPPSFHTGGIIPAAPGDQGVMMNALPGEAVLNRDATQTLGAEGVDALNSGQSPGGAISISMVYKHRIFDTFVQQNISKGGPLRDAIKDGRRVGHRGR